MITRIKIVINPEFERLRNFIESVPGRGDELGDVIYKARNCVFKNVETGTPLCIKSFRVPPIYNRLAYTLFRKSKARRSYENAVRLMELNILTPAPVAYIEVYDNGLLQRSYYICLMVESETVRVWQRRPDGDEIERNLVDLICRLHSAKVWHRDLSPGNVLFDKNANYYVIDINRMRFGVESRHKFAQNFARLNESGEVTERIAKAYAQRNCPENIPAFVYEVLVCHSKFWLGQYRKMLRRARKNGE